MKRVGVAVASVTDSVENEQAASAQRLVAELRFLQLEHHKRQGEKYIVLRNQRETDHVYGNFLDLQGGDRCTDHGSGLSEKAPMDETSERLDLGQRAKQSMQDFAQVELPLVTSVTLSVKVLRSHGTCKKTLVVAQEVRGAQFMVQT